MWRGNIWWSSIERREFWLGPLSPSKWSRIQRGRWIRRYRPPAVFERTPSRPQTGHRRSSRPSLSHTKACFGHLESLAGPVWDRQSRSGSPWYSPRSPEWIFGDSLSFRRAAPFGNWWSCGLLRYSSANWSCSGTWCAKWFHWSGCWCRGTHTCDIS